MCNLTLDYNIKLIRHGLGYSVESLADRQTDEYTYMRVEKWPDLTAQVELLWLLGRCPLHSLFVSLLGYCPTQCFWEWPLIVLGFCLRTNQVRSL
jgi:hypothetical protein